MATPKTLAELDLLKAAQLKTALGFQGKKGASLAGHLNIDDLKAGLKYVKDTVKAEEKRLIIYKSLEVYMKRWLPNSKERLDLVEKEVEANQEIVDLREKQTKAQRLGNAALSDGNRLLQDAIANNKEIFRISHEMQLESNVTWKNYTKLYNEAYKSARQANREVGQSIHNVKDLVETQNKLLGAGWKNIDTKTLTNVSTAVMTLSRTLGKLDTNLITAFEQSFRLYGQQTDTFVTNIGNRLNAFSNTFGIQIGMLQGAVVDMIDSNNFINRSNMQANMRANESLIKAAALSGAIGLTSTTFLTTLAKTSQFGTMEQMAQIYQGGALLQGFDTAGFQQNMIGGNYEQATTDLLKSIHGTLNNIDDHYLRAEYMSQIGSTFGLSNEELIRIATHGDKLGEYSADLQEKLVGVNTSMVDELSDLKVAFIDRIDSWVQNTWASEQMGAVMQEFGLYGISGLIRSIQGQLGVIIYQNSVHSGGLATKLPGVLGGHSAGTPGVGGITAKQLGVGAGGLAIGIVGNTAGRAIQAGAKNDLVANLGGGLLNVGSGIASGAMIGSIIPGIGTAVGAIAGGIIGGIAGGINTWVGANERKSAQQEIEDTRRAKNAASTFVNSGDPIVDAINNQTNVLSNIIGGNFEENKKLILISETYKNTTTMQGVG